MNLFELNQAYRELEERDDLDLETLKDTLDSIEGAREVKLDNIATWIDKNKRDIEHCKTVIERNQKAKKALIKQNEWLKNYMTQVLDDAGIKKITTENYILQTKNNPVSTVVDDFEKLPDEFKKTETKVTADKIEIRKALSAGEDVPGAHLKHSRGTTIK